MVAAGALVTVQLSGEVSGVMTADRLTSLASESLARNGFGVRAIRVDDGGAVSNLLTGRWLHYLYTATLTVQLPAAYADANDVALIVAHAFYEHTAIYPQAMSAVEGGDDFVTGIPATWVDNAGSALAEGVQAVWSGVGKVAQGAQADTQLVIVGVVLVAALVVYALATSHNTKFLAALA